MGVTRGLETLDYQLWRSLVSLAERDPYTHVYLIYDLVYQLGRTTLWLHTDEVGIIGYILIWRGDKADGIHVWGEASPLIGLLELGRDAVIQVHNPRLLDDLLLHIEKRSICSEVRVEHYLDMAVSEETFRPYRRWGTVRLNPRNPEHVRALAELKSVQGRPMAPEEAARAIKYMRYHGIFAGEKLVSIAGAYVRTPRIWVIGDVYTHPEYRGRGYAKSVTSSITELALASGAEALLHVSRDNKPAVRVYESLGYRVVAGKPWVTCKARAP